MRIAILCPGPSVMHWPSFDESILIGVNRAPAILEPKVRCHWWAFCDYQMLLPNPVKRPSYPVRILMSDCVEVHMQRADRAQYMPETYTLYRDLGDPCPYKPWTIYTVTAAMMLAKFLGASEINCYGCDHTNEPDADGVNLEGNRRDESRWKEEGFIRGKIIEWMNSEGVKVNRRLPWD